MFFPEINSLTRRSKIARPATGHAAGTAGKHANVGADPDHLPVVAAAGVLLFRV